MRVTPEKRKLKLSKKEYFLLISIPVCLCLIFLFLANRAPTYLVEATIITNRPLVGDIQRGSLKKINRTARIMIRMEHRIKSKNAIATQQEKLAILRSDNLVDIYINKYKLKPVLFPKRWDNSKKYWKKPKRNAIGKVKKYIFGGIFFAFDHLPRRENKSFEPRDYLAAKRLKRKINIKEDKKTSFIRIKLKWKDPEVGADIVNNLVSFANKFIAEKELARTEREMEAVKILLSKSESIKIQKFLLNKLAVLQYSAAITDPIYAPAFKFVSRAYVPEQAFIQIPKIKLIFLFILSAMVTFVGIVLFKSRSVSIDNKMLPKPI